MDDNQCRVCLGEAVDKRLSVFKRVNGVAIEEQLQFVAGLTITRNDNFSKLLCKKCFSDTCTAYTLKTKCLDTDRTLKSLERKFETKLQEKMKQILVQNDAKETFYTIEEDPDTSSDIKPGVIEIFEEDPMYEIFEETPEEHEEMEIEEVFPATTEIYEEVEYLETDLHEEEFKAETFEQSMLPTALSPAKHSNFYCIQCKPKIAFKYEISLKKHKWEVHQIGESNPLICPTCSYDFTLSSASCREDSLARMMSKHLEAHDFGKMRSCSLCPQVFKSLHSLEDHKYRQHQNPQSQNKCKGCLSDFGSFQDLQVHLIASNCKESHERPFRCYVCDATFVMGIAKKKHVQTEHQDKAGADCPLCLRCKIPSAVAFENHYKTHFAEPRFCCSYCGRPFYESDRLQTHIKRAHETTKFICNWCNRSFRDKSGIARHILGVHFNQRNHQCNLCSKAFTASYNLKEHLFSVHKQASKFYTCNNCSQAFLYRKQFERHRNKCEGIPDRRRR